MFILKPIKICEEEEEEKNSSLAIRTFETILIDRQIDRKLDGQVYRKTD